MRALRYLGGNEPYKDAVYHSEQALLFCDQMVNKDKGDRLRRKTHALQLKVQQEYNESKRKGTESEVAEEGSEWDGEEDGEDEEEYEEEYEEEEDDEEGGDV